MKEPSWNERHGWQLFVHPAFRRPYDNLVLDVASLRSTLSPKAFAEHAKVKILARINKLILDEIPSDPGAKRFEQGNTLGPSGRHRRRAKFFQRFRLFFFDFSQRRGSSSMHGSTTRARFARGARGPTYTRSSNGGLWLATLQMTGTNCSATASEPGVKMSNLAVTPGCARNDTPLEPCSQSYCASLDNASAANLRTPASGSSSGHASMQTWQPLAAMHRSAPTVAGTEVSRGPTRQVVSSEVVTGSRASLWMRRRW